MQNNFNTFDPNKIRTKMFRRWDAKPNNDHRQKFSRETIRQMFQEVSEEVLVQIPEPDFLAKWYKFAKLQAIPLVLSTEYGWYTNEIAKREHAKRQAFFREESRKMLVGIRRFLEIE